MKKLMLIAFVSVCTIGTSFAQASKGHPAPVPPPSSPNAGDGPVQAPNQHGTTPKQVKLPGNPNQGNVPTQAPGNGNGNNGNGNKPHHKPTPPPPPPPTGKGGHH